MGYNTIRITKKDYKEFNYNFTVLNIDTTIFINAILKPVEKVVKSKLTLQLKPSGNIFLDNIQILSNSSEKISRSVKSGRYNIRFENSNLGRKDTSIFIKEGIDKELICYFNKNVNIVSLDENDEPCWGTIIINNSPKGTTPNNFPLTPGSYNISVTRLGYETLDEAKSINISPSFSTDPIKLVFHLRKK